MRVPADALLGGVEGQGFVQMMRELPRERLIIGVQAVHGAKGALDATVRYVQERQAFGQNLAQFQNTRFTLAQCATDIAAAEAFLNACVHAYQRGELTPEAASALKLHTSELMGRVADQCLQLFGGYGYMGRIPRLPLLDRRARAAYLWRHVGDHERAGGAGDVGAVRGLLFECRITATQIHSVRLRAIH
jgi:acyl-CoA dehydrogenase